MKYGLVKLRANILLFLTALIWGSTFVTQKTAMASVPPLMFNSARSFVGAFSLLLISLFFHSKRDEKLKRSKKVLAETGVMAGVFLFVGMSLQQVGIVGATAGHAGFISSLYILIVPLFSLIFGQKIKKTVWFGIFLALVGLYLLCAGANSNVQKEDIIILFSTLFFAVHIIWISKYAKKTNAIKLSSIQFFTVGILSLIASFLFEYTTLEGLFGASFEIVFAGVLSCAVAYTFQISAQKHIKPYIASLILSLESVFSVLAGYIFLHEILSIREIFGCFLMFAAILIAEYDKKSK